MAESGIKEIRVDLIKDSVEVIPNCPSVDSWSLGCDIVIDDVNAELQEIRVADIMLSGNITTGEIAVDIDSQKEVIDLGVSAIVNGINSALTESQIVPYEDILKITTISPEATNETRYASSAFSAKAIYDLITYVGRRVDTLEFTNEQGGVINKEVSDRLDALEKNQFFERYDDQTIKTKYNLFSDHEISALGLNTGTGGGGESGGGAAYLKDLWDVTILSAANDDILVYNGTHWVNKPQSSIMPDLSVLNNYLLKTEAAELYLVKDAAKDFASVSSVTDLSNALVQLSETYGNRLNALEKIVQWFHLTQDEQAIYTEKNFYSEKEISAHGLNLGGGSGEGGAIELGNIIGVSLHSPVTGDVFVYNGTHWTNISQSELVPDLSGYATTDSVSTVSNRVNTVDNKVKSLEDRLNDLESEKFFFKLEGADDVIYTPYNLFSEKEMSAHGLNYGSGSGASGLLTDLLDVKAEDSTSGDLLVFDGTHWINTPQSAIVPSIDTSVIATREWVGQNYASTSDLSNGVKEAKAYTDALRIHVNEQDQILSGQISKILDWFTLEDGVLLTKYNLASEKEVSALGINASQGGGTSYNRLDSWSAYDNNKAGYVLSALLGYDLHTRLISVENRTVDLSGYYTKAQTDARISSAIAGIDLTPYATTAALNKAITDLDISQYAKSADVANTYATIAALNTLEGKHNTLRNEFDALSNLLSSDTTDYINTWNEVVAFLDGYKDESDLATILSGMNADISSRLLTSTFDSWKADTYTPLANLVAKHTTRLNGIDTSITNINTRIDGVEDEFDTFLAEYNAFRANFEISDDLILVRKNFASTEEISAHGINQGTGGGGGSSFSRLDAWADYDSNKAGYVLSAYLGYDLNSRLTVVENKKVDLSGYYTKEQTDAKISSAVGAIDFTPYAKSADVAKTYATIAALNLIDGRVGTLEKAGYATTGYVDSAISGIDFTPYAKKKDVADTYATKESLTSSINGLNISQYAKSSDVAQTYATKNELTSSINGLNISQYAKSTDVAAKYATKDALTSAINGLNISQYATTAALNKAILDLNISQYAKTDDVASTYATIAALNGLTGLHNTLRNDFDALYNLLNDDTAGVINTWNEVVDFINEYSGSDDLETILAGMNTNIASRLLASDFNTWVANTYTPLANRVGVAEGNITSLQTLTGTHTTQISGLTTRMGTAETNISNNASAIADNKADINKLLGWFKIDSDGNVYTEHNFYSTQQISAKGLNAGGGSGSSYNRLDAWTDYDSSKAGYVLSALLGYDLHSRVSTLENKNIGISNLLSDGIKIGTLTVGSDSKDIYAPATYAWNKITDKPSLLGYISDEDETLRFSTQMRVCTGGITNKYLDIKYNSSGVFSMAYKANEYAPTNIQLVNGTEGRLILGTSEGTRFAQIFNLGGNMSRSFRLEDVNYAAKRSIGLFAMNGNEARGGITIGGFYNNLYTVHYPHKSVTDTTEVSSVTLLGDVLFRSYTETNTAAGTFAWMKYESGGDVMDIRIWDEDEFLAKDIKVQINGNEVYHKGNLSYLPNPNYLTFGTKEYNGTEDVAITQGDIKSILSISDWALEASRPSYSKSDVGLGNVENKSSATIRGEITSANVTNALGYIPYNAANFTKANIKSTLGISDWALETSKPTYSWTDIDGRPTNLSQFTDDVVSGKYLPLTGGTLTGILTVGGASVHPTVGNPYFQLYQNNKYWYWQADDNYTYIGGTMRKALQIDQEGNTTIIGQLTASNINGYTPITSGNYSQYAPTLTGTGASGTWGISAYGLAKVGANASGRYNANELTSGGMMVNGSSFSLWDNAPIEDVGSIIHFSPNRELYYSLQLCVNGWTHDLFVRNFTPDGVWNGWKQFAFTDSNITGNAASASKVMLNYSYKQNVEYPLVFTSRDNIGVAQNGLVYIDYYGMPTYNTSTETLTVPNLKFQTPRYLWGQSFDGTGNVSGDITMNNYSAIKFKNAAGTSSLNEMMVDDNNYLTIGYDQAANSLPTRIDGSSVYLRYGTAHASGLILNSSGNVGIGTADPQAKLDVSGDARITGKTTLSDYLTCTHIRFSSSTGVRYTSKSGGAASATGINWYKDNFGTQIGTMGMYVEGNAAKYAYIGTNYQDTWFKTSPTETYIQTKLLINQNDNGSGAKLQINGGAFVGGVLNAREAIEIEAGKELRFKDNNGVVHSLRYDSAKQAFVFDGNVNATGEMSAHTINA